jgi:hypothetical protein
VTQPDRTNHERVLHHLRTAAGHLETARMKSIDSTQAHLDTQVITPVDHLAEEVSVDAPDPN